MQNNNLDQHVTVLGWVYIAMNALLVLAGLCTAPFIFGGGLISGDSEAFAITTIVAISILGFMFLLALPGILAGWGLLKRKSWARILAIILGILNLPSLPIGTIVGVYTLWVLLQSESSALFNGPKEAYAG
jgi:hypothetical protein